MRKILLLLLVTFMFAGTAAATNTFVTAGDVAGDVLPGDTGRVTFNDDLTVGGIGGFGDFKMNIDQYADIPGVEVKWITTFTLIPGSVTAAVNGDGIDVTVLGMNFSNSPVGDIYYYEFTVANDAVVNDTITISHTAGSWNGAFPKAAADVVLTVVPEPMTIALLGLGGLFLRRRK
jgi:hypothetical protein